MAGELMYPYPPPEWEDPAALAAADASITDPFSYEFPPPEWEPPPDAISGADIPAGLGTSPSNRVLDVAGAPSTEPVRPPMTAADGQEAAMAGARAPVAGAVQSADYEVPSDEDLGPRPKDFAGQMDYDTARQKRAVQRMAKIEGQAARSEAAGEQEKYDYQQTETANMRAAEAKRQQFIHQEEIKINAEIEDLKNAKIDEDQWWDGQSTGQKIGWAIAAALAGGLAVTQGRGGNEILDQIKYLIGKNLEVQKANIANRRDALGARQSFYGQLLQRTGDERAADQLFYAMGLDNANQKLKAIAAQYKNPAIQERAAQVGIGLDAENAKAKNEAAIQRANTEFSRWATRAQIAQGDRRIGLDERQLDDQKEARKEANRIREEEKKAAAQAAGAKAMAEYEKDQRERSIMINGQRTGTVNSEPEGREARKMVGSYNRFRREAEIYKRLTKEYGKTGFLSPTDRKELERAWGEMVTIWKSPEQAAMGVLAGPDMEIAERSLTSPQGYMSIGDNLPAIDAAISSMNYGIDTRLDSMGYTGPSVSQSWTETAAVTNPGSTKVTTPEQRQIRDIENARQDPGDWQIEETKNGKSRTKSGLIIPANDPIARQDPIYDANGNKIGVMYTLESGQTVTERLKAK